MTGAPEAGKADEHHRPGRRLGNRVTAEGLRVREVGAASFLQPRSGAFSPSLETAEIVAPGGEAYFALAME
jgi:hypothetical protein